MNDVVFIKNFMFRKQYGFIDRKKSYLPDKLREAGIKVWLVAIDIDPNSPYEVIQLCIRKKDEQKFFNMIEEHKKQILFSSNGEYYNLMLKDFRIRTDTWNNLYKDSKRNVKFLMWCLQTFDTLKRVIKMNIITPIKMFFHQF